MKAVELGTPANHAQLDVSALTKGLFVIKVHTEDGRVLDKKFFKQ